MIINTKELVYKIREQIKEEVAELNYKPRLLIIQIEGDRASDSYVKNKMKLGAELGLKVGHQLLPYNITQKELENLGRGTTFMELSSYDLGSFKIPIPPINDQMKIAKYLDSETDKLHSLLLKIHENNELLEEYKTSLIHHVVTGKIDVRNEI
jgi:5,10-methylene-tetrahydrofolate dehydrogenase/methenyl tetrahydrofolate cyclohydrolase